MTKAKALTEDKWNTADQPYVLLRHLQQRTRINRVPGGQRRLRLFACACCRHIWDLLADTEARHAIDVSERAADGLAKRTELAAVHAEVADLGQAAGQHLGEVVRRQQKGREFDEARTRECMLRAVANATSRTVGVMLAHSTALSTGSAAGFAAGLADMTAYGSAVLAESHYQCDILRDIMTDLIQPVSIDPAWLTWHDRTVVHLARQAYDERPAPNGQLDQARFIILADALEEAGCTNSAVLEHCRGTGSHVRGCWVLDSLLGLS